MKAVILAGGEGERLRPLSLGRPKPMTELFDRPVLSHIIALLRQAGITEIAVTLRYMPRTITDYFGDGAGLGVHLRYYVETEPLGTAGGVRRCLDFLGTEDFLVISGDAVCDLELGAAMSFHAARSPAATLLLHRQDPPLEYGLVVTDAAGRIERFIEKPGWGQVITDRVNTGIYLLSRRAMDLVPDGQPFDFGKDLFPLLLERGEELLGFEPAGYWRDMGDCGAYLSSVEDALSGKVRLSWAAPRVAPGVWSLSSIPEGVELVPPCYIGANVAIGPGSLIGPHAVVSDGTTVGRRCLVQRSVLQGARLGSGCTLYGALVCRGAVVEDGAVLNEGAVVGEEAVVGRSAVVQENVKIWPRRRLEPGERLCASLTHGGAGESLKFSDGGVFRGSVGEELTPESLHLLGNLLGREGKTGLAWSGGNAAAMLAQAALSGMTEAGGAVLCSDAPTPAAGAWLAAGAGLSALLFIEQEEERMLVHLFDRQGLPLPRARQRKLESALFRAELTRMPAQRVGAWETVRGVALACARAAAQAAGGTIQGTVTVAVEGTDPANKALSLALEQLGCTVVAARREGIAAFRAERGGFSLRAWDESGTELPPERVLTLCAMLELRSSGRAAVPPAAPAAIDLLAKGQEGAVLRLGRDGETARELYASQHSLRFAPFAACRLCARMARTGERLRLLDARVPLFRMSRAEVPLRSGRGAVMQALLRGEPGASDQGEGVRFKAGDGWVYITPLTRRKALQVIGEGFDMETAQELCGLYVRRARELDREEVPPA